MGERAREVGMFVSDLAGLLGTAFCFAIALTYIWACDALKKRPL
jgi:hypothetical protein